MLSFAFPASAVDAEAGKRKAEMCAACHGPEGNSDRAIYPSLAAQPPLYVYYQLLQFREGRRKDDSMTAIAARMSDGDMKDIAAYYEAQAARAPARALEAAQIEAGKAIAARNYCGSCHMPSYAGQKHIPRLAGQHYEYLVKELRGFKTGARPDIDGSMASAAQPLADKDITDMAAYLAGLR
ncbi:MAG: c-type cytochrome [Usitatibacter sp.]